MRPGKISTKPAVPSSGSSWIHRFKLVVAAGIVLFLLLSLTICPLCSFQHRPEILSRKSSSSWISSTAPSFSSSSSSRRRPVDVLHYSSLEASDSEKEKIQAFLDDRSSSRVWRHPVDGYERRQPTALRRVRDRRWAPDLSNPRYAPYTGEFRAMLQGWAARKRFDPGIMRLLLPDIKKVVDRHYNLSTRDEQDESGRDGEKRGTRRSSLGYDKNFQAQERVLFTNTSAIRDDLEKDGSFAARRDKRPGVSPYRTCAVVGNGGYLLNRTYGSIIDSHQMVMRLNHAKVVGFERWVGSKTTISFVNSNIIHSCSRRLRCSCSSSYGDIVPTVSYICQVAHFLDVAYCRAFRKAPLLVTDPRFDSLSTRLVRYYSLRHFFHTTGKSYDDWNKLHDGTLFHYSSGMQAVMLALGICDKVSLFGFGKLWNSTHHYHTNQRTELALHDYEAEYILYDDLANRPGLVPFLNESGLPVPPVKMFL